MFSDRLEVRPAVLSFAVNAARARRVKPKLKELRILRLGLLQDGDVWISLGNAMFAGPKFGPKVKEENAKAMALDDKNPRVWASLGRQYLMAPKMFGGDVTKPSRVSRNL
jgi:hypothetical protein